MVVSLQRLGPCFEDVKPRAAGIALRFQVPLIVEELLASNLPDPRHGVQGSFGLPRLEPWKSGHHPVLKAVKCFCLPKFVVGDMGPLRSEVE